MRRILVVLLALGLLTAVAMPVFAADVKFSGSYVTQGYYEKNRKLSENPEGTGVSNIWQRLRLQSTFQVAEGLSLTTRFDAMEKIWGASRSATATATTSVGNNQEAENIKFEHVYVTFATKLGTFDVGYQAQGGWGTDFGNTTDQSYGPRIKYTYVTGPLTWQAIYEKVEGNKAYSSTGPAGTQAQIDADQEQYSVSSTYKWGTGSAGILAKYYLNTDASGATASPDNGYKARYWQFTPFVKATTGPVYLEGEFAYRTGKKVDYERDDREGVDYRGWSAYLMANVTLGPAYVGATGVYVKGDKLGTTDKDESGPSGGTDFNPCLILFNYDLGRWNGGMGWTNTSMSGGIGASGSGGARLGQVFVGVKPVKPLDVKASFTYAKADEVPANTVKKEYGKEFDITATYKIYDNLSYMLGFGYLWAGDYFKSSTAGREVDNDYLVTHKLTLTF